MNLVGDREVLPHRTVGRDRERLDREVGGARRGVEIDGGRVDDGLDVRVRSAADPCERQAAAAGFAGVGHDRIAVAGGGMKPLVNVVLTVPARAALPVIVSWPYSLLAALPPISMVSVAPPPWV